MITSSGKESLLNSIAGTRKGWASSILVGIGNTATTSDDAILEFSIGGGDISTLIVDPINNKIYFKATLRAEDEYEINEIGCYSTNFTSLQQPGQGGGALMIAFGNQTNWVDLSGTSISDAVHARAGSSTIKYSLLASASASGYTTIVNDMSVLKPEVQLSFAYFVSNLSALDLRFTVDSSNYYHYTGWSLTNGYHIAKILKSDFVAVGSPDWALVNALQVNTTATGSAGALELDALRYDFPADTNLLTRVVVSPAIRKVAGKSLDVEYVFDLGFA